MPWTRVLPASRVVRTLFVALVVVVATTTPSPASASSPLSPQVALDWNLIAVNAVRAARTLDGLPPGSTPRPFYQPEGLVYMSYVQAAVYDAVMKISHRYQLYHHFSAGAGNASPDAAVIAASYNTLVFYLGDPGGVLAGKYAAAVAALPAGAQTTRGIAVGQLAAADITQLRAGDGRNAPISATCPVPTVPPTPGSWLCAPAPAPQSEITPWLGQMRPFFLDSSSQFRAPAPPALGSALYQADLDEVRTFGAVNSTVRTPEQTAIAWFWNGNVISQYNQALRGVAVQHNMDLVDTVRLLAMGNMIPADSLIGCFESKYHYLFWRPVTAIRADGNPADATWTPLVAATPQHPEYPSAHGCATSAFGAALADVLGTTNINVTIPGGQFGSPVLTTTRTYATEGDLDAEMPNARVWIGFHYRNSVLQGEALGHSTSAWIIQRFFLPTDDQGSGD